MTGLSKERLTEVDLGGRETVTDLRRAGSRRGPLEEQACWVPVA